MERLVTRKFILGLFCVFMILILCILILLEGLDGFIKHALFCASATMQLALGKEVC